MHGAAAAPPGGRPRARPRRPVVRPAQAHFSAAGGGPPSPLPLPLGFAWGLLSGGNPRMAARWSSSSRRWST
eukprot:889519-Heterocapsa_arctica.AAC.1